MIKSAQDNQLGSVVDPVLPQNGPALSQVRAGKNSKGKAEVQSNPMRILLVEDQPDFGRLIREFLLDSDAPTFQVRHVENLASALAALSEQPFDAALLDLTLPDSMGLGTFQRILTVAPNLPVIILTGIDDEDVGVVAIKSGAQDFLPKQHLNLLLLTRTLQYAAERKQMEVHLRQSQKMEAVGQLASGIAHEFNNLLTAIQCNLSLLQDSERLVGAAGEQDSINSIKEGAAHAATLTRQLLTFSRRQVMEPRVMDLNRVLEGFNKMLRRMLGEQTNVSFRYEAAVPGIKADPGMVEQIVLNLALNSKDAMPSGGELIIETSQAEIDLNHVQNHPQSRVGKFVCLQVSDSGCGIAPEHLPKLFQPFFTTKESGRGAGLGLATVQEIVNQHRGWIEVESALNKGTVFRIYFPTTEVAPATPASDDQIPKLVGTETILLVEDDPTTLQLVGIHLRRHGYNVIASPSGRQALQLPSDVLNSVQLLLTDVIMPDGINGVGLAKEMQRRNPGVKIVFMSGYSAETLTKNIILPEGVILAQKPFDPKFILRLVREAFDAKAAA